MEKKVMLNVLASAAERYESAHDNCIIGLSVDFVDEKETYAWNGEHMIQESWVDLSDRVAIWPEEAGLKQATERIERAKFAIQQKRDLFALAVVAAIMFCAWGATHWPHHIFGFTVAAMLIGLYVVVGGFYKAWRSR